MQKSEESRAVSRIADTVTYLISLPVTRAAFVWAIVAIGANGWSVVDHSGKGIGVEVWLAFHQDLSTSIATAFVGPLADALAPVSVAAPAVVARRTTRLWALLEGAVLP